MKKYLLGSAAIAALIGARAAYAADIQIPAAAPAYNWTGFYAGVTAGAAWGQYDAKTSTNEGGYLGRADAGVVNATGAQTVKANGFVTGIEGGYNWQTSNLLLGVEADLQAIDLNGSASSGGVPYAQKPLIFTITSFGSADWLLTARPRIGVLTANNWLFYVTGGLAVTGLQEDFSFVDALFAESGKIDTIKAGYAAGAGIEAPLTNNLTVKADYLHVGFGNTAGVSTENTLTPMFPSQVFTHSGGLNADMIRVGLNYHFGEPAASPSSSSILPVKMPPLKTQPTVFAGWEMEVGARLWLSSGVTGAPDPFLIRPAPGTLGSRLTFSDLDAVSGETFARADHNSGFFVKGYLGAGGISSANINDEDAFPESGGAYSNTLSSVSGHIGYATIDLGYNFFRVPDAKLGAFIGYNYYAQALLPRGCTQLAGSTACVVPPVPSGELGQAENDHYNSLRVGLSSEVAFADRLKLTTEAAYVPLVTFAGLDDHLPRQLLYFESSNSGSGVMLEAALDYNVTEAWSFGLGARYWAWNMNTGTANSMFLTGGPVGSALARFDAERYGVFAQTSYRWGSPPSSAQAPNVVPTKAPMVAAGPVNWTGFYIGGHLGGGFSNDSWSDPFGSSPGFSGAINIAGFGDTIHATGPVGGGQIGANWQMGAWVLGAQFDASAANMRGDNTCFSDLGGVNCQRIVNSLGTVAGRVGYAWGRSLGYVTGGAAWSDTTYNLLGNLDVARGSGSASADVWGWTVGGGIEYALNNHWSSFAEYDHIGMPSATLTFPTVTVVNTTSIGVKQSIDLFKLGVNYKI